MLVVTDLLISVSGKTIDLNHIFIYDLRVLSAPPITLTVDPSACNVCIGAAFDTDELEYNPLNQRAYVANTLAPYFLTVVDLVNNVIVDQIPVPSNPEQPWFYPAHALVSQVM